MVVSGRRTVVLTLRFVSYLDGEQMNLVKTVRWFSFCRLSAEHIHVGEVMVNCPSHSEVQWLFEGNLLKLVGILEWEVKFDWAGSQEEEALVSLEY